MTSVPRRPAVSRRAFLGGALAALTVPAAAGCSTVTRSTDIAAINAPVRLPTYARFAGPAPDLPTVDPRMPDAFRHFPADRPSVLAGATPGDGSTITGATRTVSPIPPTHDRNAYWQALDDRLGSPLDLTITPDGDYASKFATSVAGDTLGDIYNMDGDFPYLPQFLEARAADLTEYLSGDAVLEYPFLANIPTESWRACVYSGGIYAVPVPRGLLSTSQLHCRADLFVQRGVSTDFGSVDELFAAAREMTDASANRWAFTHPPEIILARMVGLPNQWGFEAGRLVSQRELDAYEEMLDLGARLVQEGLVHPDGTSAGSTQRKLWFNEGSAVMMQDTFSALPGFYQQNVAGEAFEIALPVIPGPDGGPAQLWLGEPNHSLAALDGDASPERIRMLLRVLNWMAAPFGTEEYLFRKFGLEGEHFTFEGGNPVLTDVGNSEVSLGAFPIQYFTDCPMPIYYAGHPEGTDLVYENLVASLPNAVSDPTYGVYSPTDSVKGKSLTKVLDDARSQIFLGREPVSSWDAVVDTWRRGGGDRIRGEFEEALAARGQGA
jgi:putative aldouronate transport system substrate-binding protein